MKRTTRDISQIVIKIGLIAEAGNETRRLLSRILNTIRKSNRSSKESLLLTFTTDSLSSRIFIVSTGLVNPKISLT